VLENYHLAESFKLIQSSESYNIFCLLSKDEYKVIRKRIVDCVLATDMTFHAKQVTYLKSKIENFSIVKGTNTDQVIKGLDSVNLYNTQQEFLNIFIHAADISNPTKPFHIYTQWADRVMDEFWLQGDKERELKLPISFLCDRYTVSKNNAQIGFMDGIVLPFVTLMNEFFPKLGFLLVNVNENKTRFKKLKEEEK
jgi:hypothetical protein